MSPPPASLTADASSTATTDKKKEDATTNWLGQLLSKYGHPATSPIYILAPMVEQSDLPFRIQCRKYGVHLCYTPMIHSKLFFEQPAYRLKFRPRNITSGVDRPVIAQLCGHDLDCLVYTAQAVAPYCDAIDLNCGCPQMIAKRGKYGAFLLDDPATLLPLVRSLVQRLGPTIPVTIKVRLLPDAKDPYKIDMPASLALYQQLIEAGVQALTVHGRNRNQKGKRMHEADWNAIRKVVEAFQDQVPVIANGGIHDQHAADTCLATTGAAGVMSAEALLERPTLFSDDTTKMSPIDLSLEYLEICAQYPPQEGGQGSGLKTMRMHVHHFLHSSLQTHTDVRAMIADATSREDIIQACEILRERKSGIQSPADLSWYYRYQTRKREDAEKLEQELEERKANPAEEEEYEAALCFDNLFNM